MKPQRRQLLGAISAWATWTAGMAMAVIATRPAQAHGERIGAIEIDHPYALPTSPGVANGAVYLRHLRNRGERADRLVAARTPVAEAVEFHQSLVDAQQVMRMRAQTAIELPPRSELKLRHGGTWHLMLVRLHKPLADGDRFPLWLRFEHAGEREVSVWVQRMRTDRAIEVHRH